MEPWRHAWREGFAPVLSTAALEALALALEVDDPRLIQGATTLPISSDVGGHWAVKAACLVGYCGWHGHGLKTVADVSAYFERICAAAGSWLHRSGEAAWLTTWFDMAPRTEMRRLLLPEVRAALAQRKLQLSAPSKGGQPWPI